MADVQVGAHRRGPIDDLEHDDDQQRRPPARLGAHPGDHRIAPPPHHDRDRYDDKQPNDQWRFDRRRHREIVPPAGVAGFAEQVGRPFLRTRDGARQAVKIRLRQQAMLVAEHDERAHDRTFVRQLFEHGEIIAAVALAQLGAVFVFERNARIAQARVENHVVVRRVRRRFLRRGEAEAERRPDGCHGHDAAAKRNCRPTADACSGRNSRRAVAAHPARRDDAQSADDDQHGNEQQTRILREHEHRGRRRKHQHAPPRGAFYNGGERPQRRHERHRRCDVGCDQAAVRHQVGAEKVQHGRDQRPRRPEQRPRPRPDEPPAGEPQRDHRQPRRKRDAPHVVGRREERVPKRPVVARVPRVAVERAFQVHPSQRQSREIADQRRMIGQQAKVAGRHVAVAAGDVEQFVERERPAGGGGNCQSAGDQRA